MPESNEQPWMEAARRSPVGMAALHADSGVVFIGCLIGNLYRKAERSYVQADVAEIGKTDLSWHPIVSLNEI